MKDFLKPTTAKIVLALILPLYIGVVGQVEPLTNETYAVFQFNFLPFIFLFIGTFFFLADGSSLVDQFSFFSTGEKILYFFTEVIAPLIILYLMSCLVMHIVILVRHKRNKEEPVKP